MLHFNDNKAGMHDLDKIKIAKVIEENTSTNYSNFYKKKQDRVNEKTSEIKQRLANISLREWTHAQKEMDELAAKLECYRDLTRHCVHIDMDAFFAAVEMRDEPRLRTVPMAVGTSAMLSTSNYVARRFGVRAAMPGFIGKKLCPQLELVPGNYSKYRSESSIFSSIFAEYDPDLAMGSLDEAYLDITEYVEARTTGNTLTRKRYGGACECRLPAIDEINGSLKLTVEVCKKCGNERTVYEDSMEFGIGRCEVVREIRFRVEQATGLTCSAGIAPNFMLAKICSDINKPNGQFELENEYFKVMDFLKDLPIRKVSGIGRVSEAHLQACDINTVGQLLERRAALKFVFSQLSQESFLRIALGLPGRPSSGDPKRKSISVERTFTPTSEANILIDTLREICEYLHNDILKTGVVGGRCITLKIKLSSFDVLTRSSTPGGIITSLEDIFIISREILEKELGSEIRLLGVRLSQLKFGGDNPTKSVKEFWNHAKKRKEESCMDVKCLDDQHSPLTEPIIVSQIVSDSTVPCPICNAKLKNDDRFVNSHIDECLNRDALSNTIGSKTTLLKLGKNRVKKVSIENYFVKK